jgi:hypothetical protein
LLAGGAQGGAKRKLSAALSGAGEQETGDIRAGDEQKEDDGSEEDVKWALDVPSEVLKHGCEAYARDAGVFLWILLGEVMLNDLHLRRGLGVVHAVG